jgi:lysophospholipid acyltransferase (LPLAT)-like uncharacterized protein
VLRSAAGQRLIARLISGYVRLVRATARWTIVGGDEARALWSRGETLIGAFWHGRLLLIAHPWPRSSPVAALISHHRDGEIIARAIANMGLAAVLDQQGRHRRRALDPHVPSGRHFDRDHARRPARPAHALERGYRRHRTDFRPAHRAGEL